MLPNLLDIAGHPVSAYGVFVSLAHLVGIGLILLTVKRRGFPIDPYVDVIFSVMVFGLLGARAGYIIGHPEEFRSYLDWIQIWKGGLSLFAGLLLAFPAFLFTLRWRSLPIWETADLLVPILPISLALVRVGCFCAGCCHGLPTNLPWGVRPISNLTPSWLVGENLHPTQIYEALFLLLTAAALQLLKKKAWPSGALASAFLFSYGLYRLLTNPIRGDIDPISGWPISASQLAASALVFLAGAALIWRSKRFPR